MADNTTELEVLDQIVDVLGGQSGQYETVVPTLQQIRDLLGGGGGGGGYNPALSVGRADALTGADTTAQWATRESTGSGAATVRSVQGAAIGYNQYVKIPYYSSDTTNSGTEATIAEDGTVTIQGTTVDTGDNFSFVRPLSLIGGHKYLVTGIRRLTSSSSIAAIRLFDETSGTTIAQTTSVNPFFATPANNTESARLYYNAANADITVDIVAQPQLFDLTKMFGAGNEPATVAEFERMYPEPYYPYSAPTLKPVRIAGIESTDAQGGELDAIEWPTQTLRAAGSVADMLYSDHVDVRVGAVDLGTLTWQKQTSGSDVYFRAYGEQVQNIAPATAANVPANIKCAKYATGPSTGLIAFGDKSIARSAGAGSSAALYVYDTDYTEATSFQTAMSGVLLFYELATPTTTTITPALPMTYKVQAGGSESIIVPDGEVSAAPVLTVAEGESAADVVMDALACIAAPDGPVATANHSVGTYLTMQGKLYKVTSAIAVGETIKSGTNVSQTTVMAELIARTA